MSYFGSLWGLVANILILVIFGLAAYDKYARRWSAKSGKHSVTGRITWSELIQMRRGNRALVSYSYRVDNKLYNGTIRIPAFQEAKIVNENPKGKEIVIYYSNKDHGFSRAYQPPTHLDIIGTTVLVYLLLPFVLINSVSWFIYWLFSINQ